MYLPKVLVATPTYEGKNYCLKEFISNVASFTYPRSRFDFMIFDNSATPNNAKYINKEFGVKVNWRDYSGMGIIEKLAETHEAIRQFAINNKYDYILHLESDVFPQEDVIEQLLWTKKKIIGVPYNLFGGGQRRVVTQGFQEGDIAQNYFSSSLNLAQLHHWFFDGTVRRVSTNGIGCTLMKVSTIKNIPFRYVPNDDSAPDTWFTRDLMSMNIPYFVHTGMLAFHWNKEDWGYYASMLNYDKTE
jgi:cellulose synthase/poly-beta-1,6-N-acetylglucosamine synthase-like glycosyltransferase